MARYTNSAIDDPADEILSCRVTVHFPRPDSRPGMVLEYRATWQEGTEFAAAAQHFGLLVTIDGQVRPGLRQLPCRCLWR